MKPSNDNSQLDSFIVNTLKTPENNLPSVDWSEVEVLLKHESKQITLPSKKYIFIGTGALVLLTGIFFLVKFIITSSPTTSVNEDISADTISLAPTADTSFAQKTVEVPAPDTVKPIDTTTQIVQVAPIDSAPKVDTEKIVKEKPVEKKAAEKKIVAIEPKKTEKKNKVSSLAPNISDIGESPENILPPDTAGKNKTAPTKIETSLSADTSKTSVGKKNKKNKKGKVTADSSGIKPQPAKSDSLK